MTDPIMLANVDTIISSVSRFVHFFICFSPLSECLPVDFCLCFSYSDVTGIAVPELAERSILMSKKKILHDISIAYLIYRNITSDDDPLTFEAFYQEYENIKCNFEPVIEYYCHQ